MDSPVSPSRPHSASFLIFSHTPPPAITLLVNAIHQWEKQTTINHFNHGFDFRLMVTVSRFLFFLLLVTFPFLE
jgi:hypothetical protein